jgi:hypothetical protein
MFDINIHAVGDATQQSVLLLNQQTGTQLGRGCFASVYASAQDRVFRITHSLNDWGYLTYLEHVQQSGGHNPWLPVIYGVDVWMDDQYQMCMRVEMERLTRPWDEWGVCTDEWKPFVTIAQEIGLHVEVRKNYDWITGNRQLMDAIGLIWNAQQRSDHTIDLHVGNMMLRGRQIVLTDPLGYP